MSFPPEVKPVRSSVPPFRPLSREGPDLSPNQETVLRSDVFCSSFFSNRGLITFENKTYVLEPVTDVTNGYKLFPAEVLQGVWGSCGSHHSSPGLAADGRRPPPARAWARRVGGKPRVVCLPAGAARDTPWRNASIGCCVWGRSVPGYLEVVVVMRAGRNQTLRTAAVCLRLTCAG